MPILTRQRIWTALKMLIFLTLLWSTIYLWVKQLDMFATVHPEHLAKIEVSANLVAGEKIFSEVKNLDALPASQLRENNRTHYLVGHVKTNARLGKSIIDVTVVCEPLTSFRGITLPVSNRQLISGVLFIHPIKERDRLPEKVQCKAARMHWK